MKGKHVVTMSMFVKLPFGGTKLVSRCCFCCFIVAVAARVAIAAAGAACAGAAAEIAIMLKYRWQ